MALTFNARAGRYADSRGRFVSDGRVRAVVDAVADHASDRMAAASQALLEGRMSLGAWQAALMQDVKLAHVSAAVIAHGGSAQMTPSRWGAVGRAIRDEYAFVRQFAEQIAGGRQPLNGTLTNRARLYGQAARATFSREYGRDQQARGFRFERNAIRSGESCAGCRAESARGWVPTGTLVPTGSRRPCLRNCKCVVQYARTIEAAA